MSDRRKRFRILSEETVRRTDLQPELGEDIENPYWLDEEAPPHPDPSKGCIQRGLCCKSSPGWFGPGEVEAAAELMGLPPDEFVRRYIVVDDIEVDGQRVSVFAPAKMGRDGQPLIPPATRVDALYRAFRGTCIFYDGKGCGIYEARPIECRHYICTNEPADNLDHEAIGRLWLDA